MAVTAEVEDRVGWVTLDRPPDNTYDAAFLEGSTAASARSPRPRWRWR
jgi:hypothetical protein